MAQAARSAPVAATAGPPSRPFDPPPARHRLPTPPGRGGRAPAARLPPPRAREERPAHHHPRAPRDLPRPGPPALRRPAPHLPAHSVCLATPPRPRIRHPRRTDRGREAAVRRSVKPDTPYVTAGDPLAAGTQCGRRSRVTRRAGDSGAGALPHGAAGSRHSRSDDPLVPGTAPSRCAGTGLIWGREDKNAGSGARRRAAAQRGGDSGR